MAPKTIAEIVDEQIDLNGIVDQSPRHANASSYRDHGRDTYFSLETGNPVEMHHMLASQRRHRAKNELLR